MPRFPAALLLTASALALAPLTAHAQSKHPALPEGKAKAMVEGVCTGCHQTKMITGSSGFTQDGWKELAGTMIDLSGNPEANDQITKYLAANFPPNTKRASKLVPGAMQLTFKEWVTPTLGQRSRDPVLGPDGNIWWAWQWGNLIGKLDPKTGKMTEYKLPEKAMPHTVTPDAKGNIWYSGNKNASLGKLDPRTGEITVYPMPDPAARDPHTAVFDAQGILWFNLQQSNMIGRLDPASGDIRLVATPTPGAKPYGIKIDAQGNPWVACNGSNCLLQVDPASMTLTEVKLPIPATTVRRLDIAADGMIWYVNSTQGRLGRYDPSTGDILEWPSPSGPDSHPYAIAVIDGIVWYNESGLRPDALVRFDPQTEQFQSWAIPSGGVHAGIVRHMRATRDGNLLIHQSSTNRIILVTLKGVAATQ
jgi:virginiamycin B lyase